VLAASSLPSHGLVWCCEALWLLWCGVSENPTVFGSGPSGSRLGSCTPHLPAASTSQPSSDLVHLVHLVHFFHLSHLLDTELHPLRPQSHNKHRRVDTIYYQHYGDKTEIYTSVRRRDTKTASDHLPRWLRTPQTIPECAPKRQGECQNVQARRGLYLHSESYHSQRHGHHRVPLRTKKHLSAMAYVGGE
jgi:hypothetical protein